MQILPNGPPQFLGAFPVWHPNHPSAVLGTTVVPAGYYFFPVREWFPYDHVVHRVSRILVGASGGDLVVAAVVIAAVFPCAFSRVTFYR